MQSKIWDLEYLKDKDKWHKETKLVGSLKGKRVLELGVGNGKTLKAILRQKPKRVVAVDFSEESVKLCRERFPQVDTFLENALKINLDEKFDVIVCYYFMNNLLEKDRIRVVKKMKSWLDERGIILFEDFAVGDMRQKGKEVEKNTILKENGLICHFFSLEELNGLFEGFSIELKENVSHPFRGRKDKRKIISGLIQNS